LPFGDPEAARLLAGNGEGEAVAQEHLGGEEREGQGAAAVSAAAAARRRHAAAVRRHEQPPGEEALEPSPLLSAQQGKVNSNTAASPLLSAHELDQSEHAVVVTVVAAVAADATVMAAAAAVRLTVTAAEESHLSVTCRRRLPQTRTMEEIGLVPFYPLAGRLGVGEGGCLHIDGNRRRRMDGRQERIDPLDPKVQ